VILLLGAKDELAWSGYRFSPNQRQRIFRGAAPELVLVTIPNQGSR